MAQFRPRRTPSIAVLQQQRVVLVCLALLAGCFRCAGCAVEGVEAVGIQFQIRLILHQCLLWVLGFEQQVGEHFAGGDPSWFVAKLVVLVGNGAQDGGGFVVFAFGVQNPSLGFLVVLLYAFRKIGLLVRQRLLTQGVDLAQVLVGFGQ